MMMSDDRRVGLQDAALSRAMREEHQHFLAMLGAGLGRGQNAEHTQTIMSECAAAMFAAAVGEAKRLVRERGEGVSAEVRRLATMAEAIESGLPHGLYLVWRTHFVDGRALCEYARVAGVSDSAAIANYRDLVVLLVTIVERLDPAALAGSLEGNEVRT